MAQQRSTVTAVLFGIAAVCFLIAGILADDPLPRTLYFVAAALFVLSLVLQLTMRRRK